MGWQSEIERLHKMGFKSPYAIMSIIQYKGIHTFGKDYRSVITKELNRLK